MTTLLIANLAWELTKMSVEFVRRLFGHQKPVPKASALPSTARKQPFSSPLKDNYSSARKETTASPLLWSPKSAHSPSIASPLTATATAANMASPTLSTASKKKAALFSANLDQFINPPFVTSSVATSEKKEEKTQIKTGQDSNADSSTSDPTSTKTTSKSTILTRQLLDPEMVTNNKSKVFYL